jgi:hypothetical protein
VSNVLTGGVSRIALPALNRWVSMIVPAPFAGVPGEQPARRPERIPFSSGQERQ